MCHLTLLPYLVGVEYHAEARCTTVAISLRCQPGCGYECAKRCTVALTPVPAHMSRILPRLAHLMGWRGFLQILPRLTPFLDDLFLEGGLRGLERILSSIRRSSLQGLQT